MIFLLLIATQDAQLAQSAEALFIDADTTYARALAQRLGAENPYERLYALKRLRALPNLLSGPLIKLVAPLVEDREPRADVCFEPTCRTTSVAEQALAVLATAMPRDARQAVVEQVVQRPAIARAYAPLIDVLFGENDIVALVKDAKNVDQQAALLLLAAGLRCAASGYDATQLAPFLASQSTLVRARAALVVLQRTDGCEHEQAPTAAGYRARAAGILEDSINREQPPSVLEDLARIGTAASPMMYVVATKLPSVAAIDALGAMKFRARPVATRLAAFLPERLSPAAHLALLRAVAAIRPPLDVVREPILSSATQSTAMLAASMQTLTELEAPVSASELELLQRYHRSQCKTPSTDCAAAERSLAQLGRRFSK